ncbi:MAG: RNase A-like domain-containing protein [Frankiaceae bacterium]
MSVPTGAVPPPAFPRPVTVPARPRGDPAAARAIAAACRSLADDVDAGGRRAVGELDGLGDRWRGSGSAGRATASAALSVNAALVVTGLRETAGRLDRFAQELERAQHHHHRSIGRLLAVGGLVAVTGAVVVVTVGALAPVGSLAAVEVGAALAGTEAAAAAAGVAEAGATGALLRCGELFAGLRPLAAALAPHLVQGLAGAGVTALDELGAHRLRADRLLEAFALTAATSAGTGAALRAVRSADAVSALPAAGRSAVESATVGAVQGGAAAADQLLERGRLDPGGLLVSGLGGAAVRTTSGGLGGWLHRIAVRAKRGQTLPEIVEEEVDLYRHEAGWHNGHTLARHVGKSPGWLRARIRRDGLVAASSFFDVESAESAVTAAIRADEEGLRRYLAGPSGRRYFLRVELEQPVGHVVRADGRRELSHIVCLKARQQGGRLLIVTVYLDRLDLPEEEQCFAH